jgi:acyl-CoA thioester hydrolase
MAARQSHVQIRVRYSETDQMGTFYNSRALEWFEVGRTEALRQAGLPYTQIEARGVMLPLVEAHVKYLGRARYDDLLSMEVRMEPQGRARIRFDVEIHHADSHEPVASGYTVHAVSNPKGRAIRPPAWLSQLLQAPTDSDL